jgi:beta-lactamase regulating signal transducer with metallopeptidase domain
MDTILESFYSPWMSALGYTLLNSLWQSLIIVTLIIILLRFIPSRYSNARYLIASGGIMLIVCFSIATYVYIFNDSHDWSTSQIVEAQKNSFVLSQQSSLPSVTTYYMARATNFIQGHIAVFMLAWMLGTTIFILRILTGLCYVQKLRHESSILSNEWSERLQRLGRQLKIDRFITLAESAAIQAPVVIGFLKPIILIPIGMTSSLTVEQLETIFLHELTHIRRKDYLINLIQSFVEAIYFFNPFVWIVSAIIKCEREHCCDDAVVEHYGNAKAYVNALATLEELRLSKSRTLFVAC